MGDVTQLEKLNALREKGILTEEEFESQKKALLAQSSGGEVGPKEQAIYVILALFFGLLGVHNFYIGRWKRGLAQLLFNVFTLFLGVLITYPWIVVDIFVVKTDGKGRFLKPSPIAKAICGIFLLLGLLWWFFGLIVLFIMMISGVAGYNNAMTRYRSNEIVSYVQMVQIMAVTQNPSSDVACSELVATPDPVEAGVTCVAHPDGSIVLSGMDRAVMEGVVRAAPGARIENDAVIIPSFSSPY